MNHILITGDQSGQMETVIDMWISEWEEETGTPKSRETNNGQ